jgi:hypothetical protein
MLIPPALGKYKKNDLKQSFGAFKLLKLPMYTCLKYMDVGDAKISLPASAGPSQLDA